MLSCDLQRQRQSMLFTWRLLSPMRLQSSHLKLFQLAVCMSMYWQTCVFAQSLSSYTATRSRLCDGIPSSEQKCTSKALSVLLNQAMTLVHVAPLTSLESKTLTVLFNYPTNLKSPLSWKNWGGVRSPGRLPGPLYSGLRSALSRLGVVSDTLGNYCCCGTAFTAYYNVPEYCDYTAAAICSDGWYNNVIEYLSGGGG